MGAGAHAADTLGESPGVAGIAAAVRAADAGWRPVLIETRTRLGGRAMSFDDVRTGLELDNCQHVVMGCCTNILELYDRLGVLGEIDWHESLWFARGGGATDALSIAPLLPAPLHYGPSFARMRLFSLGEKLAISRAFLAILRMGPRGRVRWQGRAFGEFLFERSQPCRKRWLRDPAFAGRQREVAGAGERNEIAQVLELHRKSPR